MGTNRLGHLPRTKTWRRIVEALVAGAGAAQVARESLEAAARRRGGAPAPPTTRSWPTRCAC